MKTAGLGIVACVVWLACQSPASAADKPATLARKVERIFRANCYRCHGQDGAVEGGFNFILDREQLVVREKIVPGDADASELLSRVTAGEMPPDGESPRPSQDDIAVLTKWIEAGAPDFRPAAAQRDFLSPEDMLRLIRADLEAQPARQRKFIRYFTVTHLFNSGLSEDELATHRHGLSKLVNSLSWGRRVVPPKPIDPHQTILRIDLRDYLWNETVWDKIIAANPYGVIYDTADATACAEATACQLPYVRADWFVATASRPPLYHEVLQLPATDRELEKLLQVDVAENLRTERVARAGFNGSGVSRNNRLIERHDSPHGAYWKSYDFGGNLDRQNLFAHPLGPGGDNGFKHDGGEIIYNLPNGLQGYMLVDAAGNRIDKGPTEIVSDPRQGDRAVVNGISCMSCHARGMIPKADQVREHVEMNRSAFDAAEAETILALYPPKDDFAALLEEDTNRFLSAVKATGAQAGSTEPIVTLAMRFEAEIDLKLASAEAGLPAPKFQELLAGSTELGRSLGILTTPSGTVQRQVFEASYASIVRDSGLGTVFTPPAAAPDTPPPAPDPAPAEATAESTADAQADLAIQSQRIKAALDQLNLTYEVNDTGNYKLLFNMGDGRTHQAIIQTNTRDFRGLRVRDVWATAFRSTGPLPADLGNRLLLDSEDRPLGAWEVLKSEGANFVLFNVKIDANSTPELLHHALLTAVQAADPLEIELTGADEF